MNSKHTHTTELTLLIQIDALRYDYLNEQDAPWLWQMAQRGITGALQPTFGFEPDAAYLAGLQPDECDGGAHYWYEPEATPFAVARYLPTALDRLPALPNKIIRKLVTAWVQRSTPYTHERVANIPLAVLPYFAPVHKRLPWESDYLTRPTLFSLCKAQGIEWLIHAAPDYAVQLAAGVEHLQQALKPPIGFAFWHIGDLDRSGHRYGPNAAERKYALRQVDAGIQKVLTQLGQSYAQVHCVIIGDHGMAAVHKVIDVAAALAEANLQQGQGFTYFLDSTMARFWFTDPSMQAQVVERLNELQAGQILGTQERAHYHLNYGHNRYGDLIFLMHPGYLISPNFFQGAGTVKGMHGYAPEYPEQQAAFVITSSKFAAPIRHPAPVDMRQIFPTVVKLLGLEHTYVTDLPSLI